MRYGMRNHRQLQRLLVWGGFTLLLTWTASNLLGRNFGHPTAGVAAQELVKLNRFLQVANAKDEALKSFRQGRDLVEEGNWSRAAAAFNSFVAAYPKHKDVDAALYWLAFALKKQSKFAEAERQLERLLREYPRSNWLDDARAMRVEMAGQTGNRQVVDRELNKEDREVKLIALQALFQSSPERAAAFVAELLKPDAKADRSLKDNAIALLGQHSGPQTTPLLLEQVRNQTDSRLRKTAIFWLGQSGGEAAVDELTKIYEAEPNVEIRKQILFALAQHHSPRARAKLSEVARTGGDLEVRKQALFGLSQRAGEMNVDELISIYDADTNTEIRKQVLFALSQIRGARVQAKLLDIARTADNLAVRRQAIFWLGQQGGEQIVATLAQLYDAEQNPGVKEELIFALSQSSQKAALHKLIQIARSDAAVELRKKAIFWLGQSRDPEATKFIEDILK